RLGLLQRRLHVGVAEIVTLEQQGAFYGFGERIGGAIGKIQPRLGSDAFALTIESHQGRARLAFVEWDDLKIVFVFDETPEAFRCGHTVATSEDRSAFVNVDR